ncbi:phage tail protein [Escherichia coli]|uniref:phage tail-collar fiber domain-containing protein n=1 Tax=Escherichia coli TaxID=562 RepID=UPI0038B4AC5A
MSTKFYTLLTDIGAAKLASAAALGVPLKITHMAVGDGGGTLPTPDAKQSALVNEKRRAALNMLYIDPQNSSQIIAEAKQGDYLVGTDENVLVLNRTYANRSNAERAAKMQWERLQRGVASFSLQLAEGRADLYTEMPVKVSGFKQPIDDAEWTITTLTHTVSPDNGFTTSLELEVRIDDFEME